jgi:hypothetical protein
LLSAPIHPKPEQFSGRAELASVNNCRKRAQITEPILSS